MSHPLSLRDCPHAVLPLLSNARPPAVVQPGEIHGIGVAFGLCVRCEQANRRLPAGTRQKRLNAAAELAAQDTSGRFWTARFPDHGAAILAAHLLAHPDTVPETAAALGWRYT